MFNSFNRIQSYKRRYNGYNKKKMLTNKQLIEFFFFTTEVVNRLLRAIPVCCFGKYKSDIDILQLTRHNNLFTLYPLILRMTKFRMLWKSSETQPVT